MTDATEEIGRESVLVLSSGICKVTSGGLKLLSFATAKIGGINSFDSRVGALPEEVMEDGLGFGNVGKCFHDADDLEGVGEFLFGFSLNLSPRSLPLLSPPASVSKEVPL
tara:strand:+ start:140 stop:469 length:330 start_codon:yes stop_codon:yes gene_type:complete